MRRKVAIYCLAAGWALLLTFWPESSERNAPLPEARPSNREGLYKSSRTKANFGLVGITAYQSAEGKRRWKIQSEFGELHRKENYAFMQEVTAEFNAERTGNVVVSKSRYGRSFLDRRQVELEGDVTIRSRKGYLFTMDKLLYDTGRHEFTSDDIVNMRGPNVDRPRMTLRGKGLVAQIDDEHFFLKRDVVAQRRVAKTNDMMRITSRTGEFFTEEGRSLFLNRVRSQLPKVALDSDVLELSMDDEHESVEASGNVVLKNRDRIGYAERAFIEVGGNRVVLEGKARVDSKNSQVRGRRILLFTDDDRVEVEEAEGKTKG